MGGKNSHPGAVSSRPDSTLSLTLTLTDGILFGAPLPLHRLLGETSLLRHVVFLDGQVVRVVSYEGVGT